MKRFFEWLFDFRGTGWVGHDPDMPPGGYDVET